MSIPDSKSVMFRFRKLEREKDLSDKHEKDFAVVSSIYMEASKPLKDHKEELKRLKRQAIIFIYENPTPIFTRQHNAEKQALIEFDFSEENVESPEARKQKLRGYVC
jgi:hypothetical protein